MPTYDTETSERRGTERGDETGAPSRAKRVVSSLTGRGRDGSAAMLAGGSLLARAIRTTRSRPRTALQVLVGATLLGLGLRQRRSADGIPAGEGGVDEEKRVSDDARAARERHDVMHRSETNPRGTVDEPDVDTRTDPHEGDVRFTDHEDDEPRPKPHLDEDDPKDPRYEDGADDRPVEVDLSEASMADEASEATGPETPQTYPAREGTDPEPTSEKAPERYGEGAVANPDSDERRGDAETRETGGADEKDGESDVGTEDGERGDDGYGEDGDAS